MAVTMMMGKAAAVNETWRHDKNDPMVKTRNCPALRAIGVIDSSVPRILGWLHVLNVCEKREKIHLDYAEIDLITSYTHLTSLT